MVIQDIETTPLEESVEARVPDVRLEKSRSGVHVRQLARGQIVHDGDPVSRPEIPIHDMGADESSASSDQDV